MGKSEEAGRETENPNILIVTDGITNTKIMIDGKELKGVSGIRFSQSYKEDHGLPILQIDLKATNVTLDVKALPALPEPFTDHYISVQKVFSSETLSKDQKIKLCRECGIGCSEITASISDGVKEAVETAIHDTNAKVLK